MRMSSNRVKLVSIAVITSFLLTPGCDFLKEHQGGAIGVGAGAVGGGIIGGVVGGKKGIVIGALAGALAGGIIGEYIDSRNKTAEKTKEDYGYTAGQGIVVKLETATPDPATVAPGGTVNLPVRYAVLAPSATQEIEITEQRTVTLNGAKVTEPLKTVRSRTPGTYTSAVPITLPANATVGTYQVVSSVTANGKTEEATTTFAVK